MKKVAVVENEQTNGKEEEEDSKCLETNETSEAKKHKNH